MGATTAMHGMQYGRFQDHIRSYLHIDQTPKISVDADWLHGLFAEKHADFKVILTKHCRPIGPKCTVPFSSSFNSVYAYRTGYSNGWLLFYVQATPSRTAALFQKAFQQPYRKNSCSRSSVSDDMAWYIRNYLDHQETIAVPSVKLDRPATFFIGEDSKLYPAQGQKLIASSVPHAKTVIFKKSGHTPLLSGPYRANSFPKKLHVSSRLRTFECVSHYQPNNEYFYNS